MSISQIVYVGVYVVLNPKNEKIEKIDLCATHNFPDDAQFCPRCGRSKTVRYTTVKSYAPDGWDYEIAINGHTIEEEFFCITDIKDHPIILIVNIINSKYVINYNADYDNQILPLTTVDHEKLISDFCEVYNAELEYVSQWFDPKVEYGLVIHYR